MTKLEMAVFGHKEYSFLPADASKDDRQKVLDSITEEVMQKLTAEEVSAHVQEIYDATIDEYVKNPHNQHVVDELIEFMSLLPQNACVLDVGCGTGRDVLYMSVADEKFRESLMGRIRNGKTTREKFSVPTTAFRVLGIDSSYMMLTRADKLRCSLINDGRLEDGAYPRFRRLDIARSLQGLGKFDGVWSCAALFTHTPRSCLDSTLSGIASIVKSGGVFLTTYTNEADGGGYDKLLMSSTGRIKYFSHPNPDEISALAEEYGLVLESEQFSDFEINGNVIKKDLFVSQLYRNK